MATPKSIIEQMGKLVEEAQGEIAKMEKSNQVAENSGGLLVPTYSPEYLQAQTDKINSELQVKIDDLRAEALGLIEASRKQVDIGFYQAVQSLGPQTPQEWAEAAARAQFVRGELATLAPADILDQFTLARDAGDVLGSWVIGTEGLNHLDKLATEATDVSGQVDARQVGDSLNQAVYGEAFTTRKTTLAELGDAERELSRPVTPGEKQQWQTGISDTFGVKAEFVPT